MSSYCKCNRTRALYRKVERVLPDGWGVMVPEDGGELDGEWYAVAFFEGGGTFDCVYHKMGKEFTAGVIAPERHVGGYDSVEAAIAYYELTKPS